MNLYSKEALYEIVRLCLFANHAINLKSIMPFTNIFLAIFKYTLKL